MTTISSFSGEYRFLSNFWIEDPSSGYTNEHRYQSCKTAVVDEIVGILNASSPGKAKRLGRRCTLRRDWEQVKDKQMLLCLMIKFSNEALADKLLATGDAVLIEGNTWGDTYWGQCNGVGENRLGKLLMEVRQLLRTVTLLRSVA